jgi:hypothetical protein
MLASSTDSAETTRAPGAGAWSPEQQIANMLELCGVQMESALQDSDVAVDALIKAFTSVAETARVMNAMAEQLPAEARLHIEQTLNKQLDEITRQIAAAVVSFQFYDKLTQRLGHVRYSLSSLAQFVCDRAQSSERDQWRRLLNALRRLYRTEEERKIFEMITEGISVDLTTPADESGVVKTGEIELF